ncbi:glycosyltransferase family 4 protein [Sporolactobacillus kofuensis]|uniref:Glycosyltransferase family 4 protein n=1 Tax=Sporolactobacillus kofuensis TaxID=269672 RepID=A0ABW1WES6_9BACL|nr:glycosyltransferase family 4 protein [Sporolactobacillus kofuensis]MCO7176713.1 glycosyltransferase family 4 protein [Sporolactobacillus kofuensis]
MNIAIVTSGYLPVPAAMGGAVEALVDNLVNENERYQLFKLIIFSTYHEKAVRIAASKRNSAYVFIKPPYLLRICDRIIYFIAKKIKIEKHMSYRYIVQRLHYIYKVGKYLKKNNYDKVVLENHATLFMALKKYGNSRKYLGRYYYHLHNEVTKDYNCRELIRNCKKVLGVSRYINNTLEIFFEGSPPKHLIVLKNCVDTALFGSIKSRKEAMNVRRKYGIAENEKIILFSGRLSKEKGIKELLLAFRQANIPDAKLVIVGGYFYGSKMESDYETGLKKLAESMNDKIIFTGFVAYQQMPSIYAMADLAVVPSMWDDPAPLTVIESMASGLPLITTVSGGIPEYVNKDCAVLLARDKELVTHLAESMNTLLSKKALRERMAEASRKNAEGLNLDHYYHTFAHELLN